MEIEKGRSKHQYIGFYTPEERKQLFLRKFGIHDKPSEELGSLHMLAQNVENPYNASSWYNGNQLAKMRMDTSTLDSVREAFNARYTVTETVAEGYHTLTRPDLYKISSMTDYFREILYNRSDLFLKIVPLTQGNCYYEDLEDDDDDESCQYKDDEDLSEIYNEIIASYFLGELVYGYSNVLSLHFMTVVDWFIALRQSVNPSIRRPMPSHYQVIISERMDISLLDYLKGFHKLAKAGNEDWKGFYRACLFQLFHALETAYHTNRYCHNDLHLENVMLQRIPPESPLFGKDFLYRRLNSSHWFRVPARDLNGYLLKIIDLGRSRLFVPSQQEHVESPPPHRHKHDRLVCLFGCGDGTFDFCANNRVNDILKLFCEISGKGVLYGEVRDLFLRYRDSNRHWNASHMLDDPYFSPYTTTNVLPNTSLSEEEILSVKDSHIVVSFLTNPEEVSQPVAADLHSSVSSSSVRVQDRCSVCLQSLPLTHKVGQSELLCGLACYEFAYLFCGKTVYR